MYAEDMSQDFSLWENHSLVRTRLALRKRQKPGKPWTEAAGSSKANGWFWFWFGVEMMNFCCSFWLFFLPFKDKIKAFLPSFLFLFFSKQLWPVLSVCQCEFKNSVFFIAVYKSLVVPVFFLFFYYRFCLKKANKCLCGQQSFSSEGNGCQSYFINSWTLN